MNCYRCGFDYTGSKCFVCGQRTPSDENTDVVDSEKLHIAVICPDTKLFKTDKIVDFTEKADYYLYDASKQDNKHVFVYYPSNTQQLFKLLEFTDGLIGREFLFNGRRRPYDTDLWLPLLWFL